MPITFTYVYKCEPGFVKVFASVGHPTSSTKTLTQGPSGHINKLQFLVVEKRGLKQTKKKVIELLHHNILHEAKDSTEKKKTWNLQVWDDPRGHNQSSSG